MKSDVSPELKLHQQKTCPICNDAAHGWTQLGCGHGMCPTCHAQHARVDHRCPFCRQAFAPPCPPPSQPPLSHMSDESVLSLSEIVAAHPSDSMAGAFEVLDACTPGLRRMVLRAMLIEQTVQGINAARRWYEATPPPWPPSGQDDTSGSEGPTRLRPAAGDG